MEWLYSCYDEAYEILPELPRKQEVDWVTDELQNLSRKKINSWLLLSANGKKGSDDALNYPWGMLGRNITFPFKGAAEALLNADSASLATSPMDDSHLSKQLLVCAPVGGSQATTMF